MTKIYIILRLIHFSKKGDKMEEKTNYTKKETVDLTSKNNPTYIHEKAPSKDIYLVNEDDGGLTNPFCIVKAYQSDQNKFNYNNPEQSNAEIQNTIAQGGFTIDNVVITDPFKDIELKDKMSLSIGKETNLRIRYNNTYPRSPNF